MQAEALIVVQKKKLSIRRMDRPIGNSNLFRVVSTEMQFSVVIEIHGNYIGSAIIYYKYQLSPEIEEGRQYINFLVKDKGLPKEQARKYQIKLMALVVNNIGGYHMPYHQCFVRVAGRFWLQPAPAFTFWCCR